MFTAVEVRTGRQDGCTEDDAGRECDRCFGTAIAFTCTNWDRTGGTCCPAGTIRADCPGKTIRCPGCGPR